MFGIDDAILGAGLSFGGKLLSGIGAGKAAKKANKVAAAWQVVNAAKAQDLKEQMVGRADNFAQQEIARADAMPSFDAAGYKSAFGSGVDMSGFMAAGSAAGFNPVTWLNSGALAYFDNRNMASFYDNRATKEALLTQGYGVETGSLVQAGYGMMTPEAPAQQTVPNAMQAIGGAVSAGADAYATSSQAAAKLSAQQSWQNALLQNVQKARAGGNSLAGLGTPAYSVASANLSGGGAAAALSLGAVPGFKQKEATVTGTGLPLDPQVADADTFIARHGWLPGNVEGLGTVVADYYRTAFPNHSIVADWAIATSSGQWSNPRADRRPDYSLPWYSPAPSAGSKWDASQGLGYSYGD